MYNDKLEKKYEKDIKVTPTLYYLRNGLFDNNNKPKITNYLKKKKFTENFYLFLLMPETHEKLEKKIRIYLTKSEGERYSKNRKESFEREKPFELPNLIRLKERLDIITPWKIRMFISFYRNNNIDYLKILNRRLNILKEKWSKENIKWLENIIFNLINEEQAGLVYGISQIYYTTFYEKFQNENL